MNYEDYMNYFKSTTICKINENCQLKFLKFSIPVSESVIVRIVLGKEAK